LVYIDDMKTCRKCIATFEGVRCPVCARAAAKKYYAKNKTRCLANTKAWAIAHPDRIKALNVSYRAEHKDTMLAQDRARHAKNRDLRRRQSKAWREANKKRFVASVSAWQKAHPEYMREHYAKRAGRKQGGSLPKGTIQILLRRQNGLCPCCNKPLGSDYHLDHIMPLALGGAHAVWNVQILRAQCNVEKGAMHPDDFMWGRGFIDYHARSSDFTWR
jgi:5-methylcytosine-specific restriction endonuclease McrA